jgi:DNA (cytosine-5)-methyltransferase 1
MRYASVCDGIGAAHVAWQPLGWECAWTSEIEPFPAAVVDHHWKLKNLGDMTKLTEEMLDECGPISLLCGGTPCQSFSVAGLRKGLEDPRGNLALRFTQLVGVLRPEWVVWENVPGVLSSGKGRDFGTFLGALAELGYGFAYRVLDAQWFGVAQRRRRVFVVAHARDWRRAAAVLFERESLFGDSPTRGAKGERVAGAVTARTGRNGGSSNDDVDSGRIVAFCNTAGDTALGMGVDGGRTMPPITSRHGDPGCIAFHPTQDPISSVDGSVRTNSDVMGTVNTNQNASGRNTPMVAYDSDTIGTIRSNTRNNSDPVTEAAMHVIHGMAVRRLTPKECERLQGFPDGYTDVTYRGKPAADGPRYRALGNSMAVPVMAWIGNRIQMVMEATDGR